MHSIQDIIINIEKHEFEGLKAICSLKLDQEAVFHFDLKRNGDFFNRVRQIRSSSLSIKKLIEKIISFYSFLNINPAISFNPLTNPDNLDEILSELGYKFNKIDVFVLEEEKEYRTERTDLVISETTDIEEFADIFYQTFKGEECLDDLKERIRINMRSKENLHLVAKLEDKLVGSVGSIGFNGIYVVYGLSLHQEFRGRGLGNLLGREIIKCLSMKKPQLVYFKSKNPIVVEGAKKFGFRKVYEQLYFKL